MIDQPMRCGDCGGLIENAAWLTAHPRRCVCGRRAVERTGAGVTFVHAPDCTGEDGLRCLCFESPRQRSFLDDMRLCSGRPPRGDL